MATLVSPPSAPSGELARQTLARLRQGLTSGEGAGLPEILELVEKLSSDVFGISVQDLAELIGKDVAVSARVLSAANSFGYNPAGVPVSTLTQSVHVIGFDKVRSLALSLLLLESAERRANSPEQREASALALCSGLVAQVAGAALARVEPEQAFLCGSLRGYGRLLLATFLLEDYRRARALAAESPGRDDAAFHEVFGLSALEVGRHFLGSARLPEPILHGLQPFSPGASSGTAAAELLAVSDFSMRLCELVLHEGLGAEAFEKQTQTLLPRYGAYGLPTAGQVPALLGEAEARLNDFARAFGFRSLSHAAISRLQARSARRDPPRNAPQIPEGTVPTAASTTPAPAAVPLAAPPSSPPVAIEEKRAVAEMDAEVFQHAFDDGIQRATELLAQSPVKLEAVVELVRAAVHDGFGAAESVLFLQEGKGDGFFARGGQGPRYESVENQPVVRRDARDVFGVCLTRREDVLIRDSADPKISAYLPSWLRRPGLEGLGAFVLLPIHEGSRSFGLILAGWRERRAIEFSPAQLKQMRTLLNLAAAAKKLSAL